MDFNFSYDVFPQPVSMFCYYDQVDKISQRIFDRNRFVPENENQLDCRYKLTKCCRYNDKARDNLPSSCSYVECNGSNIYTPNVGYRKHYFNNIDAESELLLGRPFHKKEFVSHQDKKIKFMIVPDKK
tara:strand:+ start:1426 stop:1809 length:384 start_codon:yes stop_codon:yes gene_type:complete